ncbi:hypothetical protein J8273_6254 [Carpediemonas membranifera]|uniref:EF-hand domain-containing protein n=1 Tax=Carpediemonas membranifera TaxID=201153 RepID=A0A8J6E260_9EUKA|nr:hypothetical protein J8273_6254 [Carpediemonas membranifera]|eukprot:KAG9391492.1 hypothetical protein J8273_6254 [Carpediemonas membranifera]
MAKPTLSSADASRISKQTSLPVRVIKRLHKEFTALSSSSDGVVCVRDFSELADSPSPSLMYHVICQFNESAGKEASSDAVVEFEDLLLATHKLTHINPEERFKAVFGMWDMDKDGMLNRGELYYLLRVWSSEALSDQDVWGQADVLLERYSEGEGDRRGLTMEQATALLLS